MSIPLSLSLDILSTVSCTFSQLSLVLSLNCLLFFLSTVSCTFSQLSLILSLNCLLYYLSTVSFLCVNIGTNKACCECLTLIIEKLVEGGPEFSQYEDDHHMDLLAKQMNREDRQIVKNHSSLSTDRYTYDDGRGRDRERERDNRKVVLSDSRSISPLPPTPRGITQRNISLNMSSLRDQHFNPVGNSSRDSGDAWDGDRAKRDGPDTRRTKERVRDWQREHQDKERERAGYGDSFGRIGSKDQAEDISDNTHFISMSTQSQDREREGRDRDREKDNKEYKRSSPYTTYNSSSASTPHPSSRPVSRPSSRANSQSNTPRDTYGSNPQGIIFTTSKTYRTPAESSRDREQVKGAVLLCT